MVFKVIVDTSAINNDGVRTFLGSRSELQKFSRVADIIIPEMVIEELKNKKRRALQLEQGEFLSNTFHSLMKIDEKRTKNFDIEGLISKLQREEDIPFQIIKLKDKEKALERMKNLALKNYAPFGKHDDRGFRDTYIYFTILEYLEECDDEVVYLLINDNRFEESFKNQDQIQIIKDFDIFSEYDTEYFKEEYFVSRLKQEISENITKDSIRDIWLNIEENWVLEVVHDNENTILLEVDFKSKEIIRFTNADTLKKDMQNLIRSHTFRETHYFIGKIKYYTNYFSDKQIEDLIEAYNTNNQIYLIGIDDDVKEFFLEIYSKKLNVIEKEIREEFERNFLLIGNKNNGDE